MRDKIFYSVSFGIIMGVLTHSFFLLDLGFILFLTLLSAVLIFYFWIIAKNNWGIVVFVFLFCISFGMLRLHFALKSAPDYLENKVGEEVELSGVLVNEPDRREDSQKLEIKVQNSEFKTDVLITTDFSESYKYGDELLVKGKIQKPENFTTDQGKEFDYVNYLKKDGMLYVVYYPDIEIISRGHGFFLKRALFSLKEKFLNSIESNMRSPESTLLGGLILGERGAFPDELREQFIDTGTIHIVALSGYNVTIVAEWFIKALKFLPGVLSVWAGVGAIFLFVLMTGAPATAIRAGIMATLALIARATGRTYDVARALVLAGLLMVLINPLILRYDVSFQLSFLATVAVIFLAPRFEKYFTWVPKRFGLRDIVAVTSAAYIFVLPIILYKMGSFSLVALPANLLILPFIPLTMALGFATGFFGLILSALAFPFAFLTEILLAYELKVVEIFSNLSFSSFSVPEFPLILVIFIYGLFTYWLFGKSIRLFFRKT